ncbi:MAG: Ig-like domain-containing protein [Dysgonamonadaceae bacterium]|jgi:hypothetical protein|nr:Ig-like domain-containing protein [Dysgonamonadaceae bacterium]
MKNWFTFLLMIILVMSSFAIQGQTQKKHSALFRKEFVKSSVSNKKEKEDISVTCKDRERAAILQRERQEEEEISVYEKRVTPNSVGAEPCTDSYPAATYTQGFEMSDATLACVKVYDEDGGGNTWVFSTRRAHQGSYSAFHEYSSSIDEKGWLVLPKITLDGAYELDFWSYISSPTFYAKSSVWISSGSDDPASGGFTKLWEATKGNTDEVPNPAAWKEIKISLAAYAGQQVYIAFYYEGKNAHTWAVDEIKFNQAGALDVGVIELTAPVGGVLTNAEQVSVNVKSFGTQSLTNVPVKLIIDGGSTVSGNIPSIPAGAEMEYTFPGTFDFSAKKKYQIIAYTDLSGDSNRQNDTVKVNITNIGDCLFSSLPYTEDMEDDVNLLCWSKYDIDGANPNWAISTSRYRSGFRSICHTFGNEGDMQNGWLVSPKISIPATGVYNLSFWSFNHFSTIYDKGRNSILISTGSNNPASNDFTEVWSPQSVSSSWEENKVNLVNYAGKDIYIAFRYQGNNAHEWYLDDVKISVLEGNDLGIMEIIKPESGINLTATEAVKIKVKNFGAVALSNVPVTLSVEGGTTLSGSIGSIGIDQEVEYDFNGQTIDLSAVKSYNITVSVNVADDTNSSNNQMHKTVTNYGDIAVMGKENSYNTCGIVFKDDGIDGNYSATAETQTVTFHPTTATNRIQAEFISFKSYPFRIWEGFPLPGDTLFVYNGNTTNSEKLLAYLTDNMTDNLPMVFRSTDVDGSLTFVFKKESRQSEAGWEANISCFTTPSYDAGVIEIINPEKGGNEADQVKIKIGNFGQNTLTFIPVAYKLNGGEEVTDVYTGNLSAGETVEYTFPQTVDLSEYNDYTLEVYTKLENDGDATNDKQTVSFLYREAVTLQGYKIYDKWSGEDAASAISFSTDNLSDPVMINDYKDENNSIMTGEYIDGNIYIYSYFVDIINYVLVPKNFIKLNEDWTKVFSKPVNDIAFDMAYDYSTGEMYALAYNEDGMMQLSTVDLETGVMTAVVTLEGDDLYTLVIDLNGNMYGVNGSGDFVSINKTTGATEVIGNTGCLPYSSQGMTFDHNTERLFWAIYSRNDEGRLMEVDPATGAVIDYGRIGEDAHVVALYTRYFNLTEPILTNINIEDGSSGVAIDLPIIFTFDRNITSSKLEDITLTGSNGAVDITPSIEGAVLTINHAPLEKNTNYKLFIPAGTIDNYDLELELNYKTTDGAGIGNVKLAQKVYPTFTKGNITVYTETKATVKVVDTVGRVLAVYQSEGELPIELNYSNGTYFIFVGNTVYKVILAK